MYKIFFNLLLLSFTLSAYAGGILPTAAFNQQSIIRVKHLAVGGNHNCAILEDSSVKCWGSNANGHLLQGNTTNIGDTALTTVKGAKALNFGVGRTAISLGLGLNHSCAILDNGSLKCWGLNQFGQLGLGHTNDMGDASNETGDNLPVVNLGAGRTALQVVAGFTHTCAILDDRTVKCWGEGQDGALGQGNQTNYGTSAGAVSTMPAIALGANRTALQIVAGDTYTCALLDNGTVKCWGVNDFGQLGQGDTTFRGSNTNDMANLNPINFGAGRTVMQIVAGNGYHTCALLDNGAVKCWGRGDYGQLGQGNGSNIGTGAIAIDTLPAIDMGGTGRVIQIAAGAYHTCALLDDSSLKCWGSSITGETGHGNTTNHGNGVGGMGASLPVTNVGSLKVVQVIANSLKTCVILEDGTAKCFGEGDSGQMGQGSVANIGDAGSQMGANLKAIDFGRRVSRLKKVAQLKKSDLHFRAKPVVTVGNHTCAILEDSTIKCWGQNATGQLGLGDTNSRGWTTNQMGESLPAVNLGTGVKVLQVSAGGDHTCAVVDNSQIKCWGLNAQGQLGKGDTVDAGSGAGQMGASLATVNLGAGRSALQVAAGSQHTCALLDDHTVKCWGLNTSGELGLDVDTVAITTPTSIVNLGAKALQIGAGYKISCALLETGQVKCWGFNDVGQLGQDSTVNVGTSTNTIASKSAINLGANERAVSMSVGVNTVCVILMDSSLKCWGNNGQGQLGQGNANDYGGSTTNYKMANLNKVNLGSRKVIQVAAGYYHTCILTDESSVKCWGGNAYGELGLGHTTAIGYPADLGNNLVSVNLGTGRKAVSITAGVYFTCATLDNSTVKCWGQSWNGETGQGSTAVIGDNAGEVGDGIPVVNLGMTNKN